MRRGSYPCVVYMSSYDTPAKCLLVALCLGGLYYLLFSGHRRAREGMTNKDDSKSKGEYAQATKKMEVGTKSICESLELKEGKNSEDVKKMLTESATTLDSFIFYETIQAIKSLGDGASEEGLKTAVANIETLKNLKGLAADAVKSLGAGVCAGKARKSVFG